MWDWLEEWLGLFSSEDGTVKKEHNNFMTNYYTSQRKRSGKSWHDDPTEGTTTDELFLPLDLVKLRLEDINKDTLPSDTKGILFNAFDERSRDGVRYAIDFRNNSDNTVGDNNIPLSNFSRYWGIVDNALKVGPLSEFSDSTLIAPIRNKTELFYPTDALGMTKELAKLEWDQLYNNLPSKYKSAKPGRSKYYTDLKNYYHDTKNEKGLKRLENLVKIYNGGQEQIYDAGFDHGKFILYDLNGQNKYFISTNNVQDAIKKYTSMFGPAYMMSEDNGRMEHYIYDPNNDDTKVNTTAYFRHYPQVHRPIYGVTVVK